ncbi:hypothetical protein B0H14DRAFT_3464161 [Mycena olivaceomarginata]|nr:hypothetical protein B0H14DRAFT_3464161 [Mycena olivaceomarginata]
MPITDDEDVGSGGKHDTPPPSRWIVDLEPDDGDEDWEDLATLGTSTHRSRNQGQPHIPVHKRKHVGGGKNTRASALKRRGANTSKMQWLAKDLDAIDTELEDHTARLATKYSMKPKNVRRRLVASSNYKLQRKPSLYNAKILVLMADLNTDREDGNRLTMPKVKVLVKDDPSLLEGYTTEEEAQMLTDVAAKCEHKHHGTHSNNVAANVDIKRTMARLVEELNGLVQRPNMVGFTMFSQGHLHDTSTPTTISSGGVLDFFREVLKREPADVSALLELWAVNREQGAKGPHTLLAMQKECTEAIAIGLMAVTKRTKIAMNYENYIRSIVEGKNVGLVGWPQGVVFKRMSLQSAIPPLQILRDALRAGTCRWKVLTPTERERIIKNFEDMVEKEEVKVKARKLSRATTKKSNAKMKPSAKKAKESSEELSEEDESGGKRASTGGGATVCEKLLVLVQVKKAQAAVKQAKRKGKAASDRDKHEKRKTTRARDEETLAKPKKTSAHNGEAPAKHKAKTTSAGDGEPPAKKRKNTSAGDNDGAPPAKRNKTSAGQNEPDAPVAAGAEAAAKASPQEACKRRCACAPCVPDPMLACLQLPWTHHLVHHLGRPRTAPHRQGEVRRPPGAAPVARCYLIA